MSSLCARTGELDEVGEDVADHTEHGQAAVLDLGLLQVAQGQPAGEAHGVEACIQHGGGKA